MVIIIFLLVEQNLHNENQMQNQNKKSPNYSIVCSAVTVQ